jgi:hypothetical protein
MREHKWRTGQRFSQPYRHCFHCGLIQLLPLKDNVETNRKIEHDWNTPTEQFLTMKAKQSHKDRSAVAT